MQANGGAIVFDRLDANKDRRMDIINNIVHRKMRSPSDFVTPLD